MVCIYSDINKLINFENTFNWFPYSLWLTTVVMIAKAHSSNENVEFERKSKGYWSQLIHAMA